MTALFKIFIIYERQTAFSRFDTLVAVSISYNYRGCPHGVMVKAMDCKIVVSEFKLHLFYHVHFQINILMEMYEHPYFLGYGLNSVTAVLLEGWLWL